MGKSAAKIRRNQARAAARGETYTPPPPPTKKEKKVTEEHAVGDEETSEAKSAAAERLIKKLAELEKNPDNLNSKDRRSAKRKAEAIAAEEAGCPVDDLLEWHAQHRKMHKKAKENRTTSTNNASMSKEDEAKLVAAKKLKETLEKLESDTAINSKERRSAKRKAEAIALEETGDESTELLRWYETVCPTKNETKKTPYILFVGQLAYTTTSEMLFEHFKTMLGQEIITNETMKVRLLTDSKTKKSKGMAFVELSTPEIMYECLKMHLTHIDGRRINVERSSGGGAKTKKSKISMYREKQSSFISDTMDKIITHHIENGDIGQDELDDGVIALCKRHSALVVEQALKEYVQEKRVRRERKEKLGEKEEEELRNPSAFFTHMIGRVAEEGMSSGAATKIGGPSRGADDTSSGNHGKRGDGGSRGDSVLGKSGVDMSISHAASESNKNMSRIFPSMQRGRGRGRGRGYM